MERLKILLANELDGFFVLLCLTIDRTDKNNSENLEITFYQILLTLYTRLNQQLFGKTKKC